MTELLIFLGGWVWTVAGMAVFSALDPEGKHDQWVMGSDYSIVHFALSLLFWPVVAWRIGSEP